MLQGHVDVKHATITWLDLTPVESAKYRLSLWHGEVRGLFPQQSAHMSPFCYLNRGCLPHLLLSLFLFPSHFSTSPLLPSYLIQEQSREQGLYVWVIS